MKSPLTLLRATPMCRFFLKVFAIAAGFVCVFCNSAFAAWHWEMLRDDYPTNTLYDGFVEFKGELYRVALQHPDSGAEGEASPSASVSKSADGLNWTVVDDNPEYPQGEVIRLLAYKDELWLCIRQRDPVNFESYTTEIWKSATGQDWSQLIVMNSLQEFPALYMDFTAIQDKIWCVGYSLELLPSYNFLLNTENGIDWDKLYPTVIIDALFGYTASLLNYNDKLLIISSNNVQDHYTVSANGISWEVFTIGPFGNLGPNNYAEQIVNPTYIFHNNAIFRLGGYFSGRFDNVPYNNIFYSYDLETWREFSCGAWWSPRAHPIAVNFKNELWVFAGEFTYGNGNSEIWRFVPGEATIAGEGEGIIEIHHSADTNADDKINLSELLALIQVYNTLAYHCDEFCGYELGYGALDCTLHSSDYNPADGVISLSELLRMVQLYNSGNYYSCPSVGEDSFCPGIP